METRFLAIYKNLIYKWGANTLTVLQNFTVCASRGVLARAGGLGLQGGVLLPSFDVMVAGEGFG